MTRSLRRLHVAVLMLSIAAAQARQTSAAAASAAAAAAHAGGSGVALRRSLKEGTVQAQVVNGVTARRGRYPYMVSLRKGSFHFCGGTLIHPRIVLTAAHCFYERNGKPSASGYWQPQVRIGGFEREGGAYELRQAARVVVHENYNANSQENDVALVLLRTNSTKKRIKVPRGSRSPAVIPGTMLTALGWGDLWQGGPPARFLQEAPLMLQSFKACSIYMPDERWGKNSMLCAGEPSKKIDTCAGDSGGPLLSKHKRGRPWLDLQVGIVSWGYQCASWRPAVYTSVSMVAPWIRGTMGKLLRPPRRVRGLLAEQGSSSWREINSTAKPGGLLSQLG